MASKRPLPTPPGTPSTSGEAAPLPRGLLDRKGNPAAKGARLPSMRTPRDLTLGGVTKKTFAPNIPARREKKEDVKQTSRPSGRGEGRGHGRGDRSRGRGRGRGRGEIIQSHSIFEEGPAQKQAKARVDIEHHGGGDGGRAGGKSISTSRRTTIKSEPGSSDAREILEKLLRDDFVDFEESESTTFPVKLPMAASIEVDYKIKTEAKVKKLKEGSIKMETDDATPIEDHVVEKGGAIRAMTPPTSCTMGDIFTKAEQGEKDQLIFFQLPDVLPGFPKPPDEEENRKKDKDKTEVPKKLANFSEGKIGKLQVLRSGRVRLLIGNSALHVSMGTPCSFLQSLVSVKIRDANEETLEAASGDMTVLGQVKHRLVCTPDFLSMIELADSTDQLGKG